MSQLIKEIFIEGETVDINQLNKINSDLQADSIDDENTAPDWITLKHLDTSNEINSLYEYSNDTEITTTYFNGSYQTISEGGTDCEITDALVVSANDVIRIQACGMISTLSLSTYDDGPHNYFAFRILINNSITAGECGYSFTPRALISHESGSSLDILQWRTFQFSHIYMPTVATVITSIKLQIKVNDVLNTVGIERHALQAIQVRK